MAISDDWQIDYPNKFIYHIDGVLSYGTGSGTQPAVGQYIYGGTSGAVGKVIDRTGNATSGTLTLTNVVGLFVSGEAIYVLSELDFDAVTAGSGGFTIGDTIVGNSSASTIPVMALEYNHASDGKGTIFGRPMSAAFTNNEQLDISGGQADVADADGTGTDNDSLFSATTTTALAVPGTASTNNSVIVHYDAGTIDIPEGARIQSSPTGAVGRAQKVYGATATGSVRVVNSDTTGGAWTNNDTLRILDCVYYDALVSGKVFSVGDRVQGYTGGSLTGIEGRVIGVIDDGDSTGKLILMDKTAGSFAGTDELHVQQSDLSWVKYAEVEGSTNAYLDAATLNLPGGVRSLQRPTQGGIYPAGSLNIVRASSDFYGYISDTFDELGQLDDLFPIKANVRDQLYTLINGWQMYDLSFRFLERGAWQDSGKNNIWTNLQSIGVLADVGDHGFLYTTTNPTPQPQLYVEQDEEVLSTWWLEGHVDILIKNKTSTDPRYITPSVPTLGQLIDDGNVTVHAREYRRTYFWVTSETVGGQSPVAFNTIADTNNTTGTHQISYTGTGGFTVGEEITCSGSAAVGIVTAESLAGDTLDIVHKTPGTAFSGTITGGASGATCTYSSIANLVAGYSADIRVITVDRKFTGGSLSGTPVYGETFTQAVSGYAGYYMGTDGSDLWFADANASTPDTNQLTGGVSGATYTPSGNSSQTSLNYNLEEGSGNKAYSGLIATDITGADAQAIADVYEYCKYLTAKESTTVLGGPGTSDAGLAGKIYKALSSTYAVDTQGCPVGHFAGGKMFGARGWFIVKEDLSATDIQNFNLISNDGTPLVPPNLQNLTMADANLDGVRVAAYRTAVENSTTIQRTEFQVGTVGGGYNQAADTAIKLAAQDRAVPMPADVPSVGIVYVLDPNDTGNYLEFPYNAVDRTNGVFTLTSGDIGDVTGDVDLTAADNAHVAFLREEVSGTSTSRSIQYVADIYVFWVARKKGFLDAKGTTTFGQTGASIACNLQADENVTLP